jgi:hypothetical protein
MLLGIAKQSEGSAVVRGWGVGGEIGYRVQDGFTKDLCVVQESTLKHLLDAVETKGFAGTIGAAFTFNDSTGDQ